MTYFNHPITTPLGEGNCEGLFDAGTQKDVLVRFKMTDEIKRHLQDENCLTHRAEELALFHFPLEQTQ